MRKIKAFLAIMTAICLVGCAQNNGAAGNVTEETTASETAAASETSSETEETAASETVTETSAETTAAVADCEMPEVISAAELYDVYPMQVIPPEVQETGITAQKAEISEDICRADGLRIVEFSAEYPVFSSNDEKYAASLEKINGEIKAYIDDILQSERTEAENFHDEISKDDEIYQMCGFMWQRIVSYNSDYVSCCGYDINGNILSVYFVDFYYGAGAAHGYETPVPMSFDLRSGERVVFSDIIADKDAFSERVKLGVNEYIFVSNLSENVSEYAEYITNASEQGSGESEYIEYGIDENGKYILGYCEADQRLAAKDGCIGFWLAPYEYGSYADSIRCVKIPVGEILPLLTDEGKALFESFKPAESRPADIIRYKGNEYPNTREYIPVEALTEGELTAGDYEFISLFKGAGSLDLNGYKNIDLAKIAEMKNIKALALSGCEIDDISPLFNSGISKIYDYEYTITKEQAELFAEKTGGTVMPEREE